MKDRKSIKIRLPSYVNPRTEWRKQMYPLMSEALKLKNISYTKNDRLELDITLYLTHDALAIHDVDNRLKDIMDALQGRTGGSKRIRYLKPLIPNDNQIYKVTIEKMLPPIQSLGMGHLVIRKY